MPVGYCFNDQQKIIFIPVFVRLLNVADVISGISEVSSAIWKNVGNLSALIKIVLPLLYVVHIDFFGYSKHSIDMTRWSRYSHFWWTGSIIAYKFICI